MLLNCHTYYSFCYGTLSVEDLLAEARRKGYDSLVLSDINNTSALLDALRLTEKTGPKVIPGIDFRLGVKPRYIGIARNNAGYRELNEHLSSILQGISEMQDEAPPFDNAYLIYPYRAYKGQTLREHEFIGISYKELSSLPFSPYGKLLHKMVVLQPLTFTHRRHYNAHRLLRAIDKNCLLSKLPREEQAQTDESVPDHIVLREHFSAFPIILQNTERLLSSCSVHFAFGKLSNKNLKHYSNSIPEDIELLRSLSMEALPYRYPRPDEEVYKRIEKELEIIRDKQFASYYLINWDITRYARNKGYFYVGRGSGANSMLAYLLRITDVDPIDLDLYFERFINEHRSNAPDFDIDFSWTDRDDITRYIFERFGTARTALLGAYSTFQHDAVTRELGKVFGLPPQEIDRLQAVKNPAHTDQMGKLVLQYSQLIHGLPSHLSIHSSGILISEEPISTYSATFLPPKGYPTTQFSMLEAEDIGLFKFDILSQRGLGKIKDAVEIVRENRAVEIDIHNIGKFKQDEAVRDLLRVGKCIGCFYVESPAMRMLLAKLQADDYLRLVAASSIIRPGVSKSGMMREYIVRFRDEEKRRQAREKNPVLYDLLAETYGVMVYQEDVIRVAHLFAGLSLAEADYLRRGMSWKFKQRNEFNKVQDQFFKNCLEKNYPLETVKDIWTQIESFANFAFSKGHSASYAVESFQALYLKAHFPLEYLVATLNNGGGFYRTDLYVHEARMHGAEIAAPCINNSGVESRIQGKRIYLGFGLISELEQQSMNKLLTERERGGPYSDLYNVVKRTALPIEQLRLLIRVGAFRSLHPNKRELLWEAQMLVSPHKKEEAGVELFDVEPEHYSLPELENNPLDDALDEIELLGFPLCSPFSLLKDPVKNSLLSRDLKKLEGKTIEIIGYLVSIKYTGTYKGEKMYFGTFLDLEGYWIDTVHFPPSARTYPFSGPGCYRIIGKVMSEFGFVYIDVSHQYRLPQLSRDDNARALKPILQSL
ncbi:MAG TPA: DNA polymerase III subunit alpha [Bacteroidia bacterium]|nr:DNA polymerase III subunit alpha [Bacteroidia bacterium]